MNRRTALKLGMSFTATAIATAAVPAWAALGPVEVTLYKDPECSCCQNYADYLRKNGFAVTVIGTHDLPLMNDQLGVPVNLQGCHLAKVEGYVVEGHVPVDVVKRLLAEKPKIKGITLPGMPAGAPGMYGKKTGPFTIYAFGSTPPKVYATE
ncbi:MAG TPA: DUF411 domain-containing protein [Stellaceae bacterium]|nr:DUF411 domain-containing protein [Stellaceae bacterium]